ncbi:MAG: serine/threonine-protein kinase [Planctomycetia bacterium]
MLVKHLRVSRLLNEAQLDEALRFARQGFSPTQILKGLVQAGVLTSWQATSIHAGHYRDFHIGKYKVVDFLGSGGVGDVYRGFDSFIERDVAIKILQPKHLKGTEAFARFKREARAMAQVVNPYIVAAYDTNLEGAVRYIVMEYAAHGSLDSKVKAEGTFGLREGCAYAKQAASALQTLYEAGIVHRDVKPENIMLASGVKPEDPPVAKLLDFSLAKYFNEFDARGEGLTTVKHVMGTPEYMAPEQSLDPQGVDYRADMYSLGCTLFWILTGQTPFPTSVGIFVEEAPLLSSKRQLVPKLLDRILAKMLKRDPAERYQKPADLVVDLEKLLAMARK